ncbi:MAG: hypothetical protein WAU68_15880 [Vitreimonas sp.]
MRALIACVLLAACATGSPLSPAQRLAGCWINRDVGAARMRWSQSPNSEGAFLGSKTTFGIAGNNMIERYRLENVEGAWRLCRADAGGAQCWAVAQGDGGPLGGGRAFIDAGGDNLRIAVIGEGPERVIFQGHREGCRN